MRSSDDLAKPSGSKPTSPASVPVRAAGRFMNGIDMDISGSGGVEISSSSTRGMSEASMSAMERVDGLDWVKALALGATKAEADPRMEARAKVESFMFEIWFSCDQVLTVGVLGFMRE
mmetsp:Transcript_3179/g.4646  ORF Transcript_3179/g.4646 Transcript_3179/m.4646 type:complete len:118 (-) Transcript_3179:21-374(-)